MSIHYVIIARDFKVILADYSTDSGNYQIVITSLLPKLEPNRRKYFKSDNSRVYVDCTDHLQYICVTDDTYKIEGAFAYLEAVKKAFTDKFDQGQIQNAISLGSNMAQILEELTDEFNNNPESDKGKLVMSDLAELKDTTAKNLST